MESYIRRIGRNSILISILLIAVGFVLLINPTAAMTIFITLFGVVLVVDAFVHIISYFLVKDEFKYFSYELALAVIDFIFGFLIICNVELFRNYIQIVVGIWILLNGIFNIQMAMNIRHSESVPWGLMIFTSLVTITFGAVMIFYPSQSFEFFSKILGSILIMTQLLSIFDSFYILRQVGKVSETMKEVAKIAEDVESEEE